MTEKKCTACGEELRFLKREQIQLGKTGILLGDWSNIFAGAQDLEFWVCPRCRKMEFYLPEDNGESDTSGDGIAQIVCPACGVRHDMDDPKCPVCGARNPNY